MILKSKVQSKLKKSVKWLALIMLTRGKNIFPRFFVKEILLHMFNVRLQVGKDGKEEGVIACRYKHGARGALCMSIDFDLPCKQFEKAYITLCAATAETLRMAERYKIRISWGIYGELATEVPALFEKMICSSVNHDLGVHTFSHMDLASPKYSDDAARSDILKCMKVLEKADRPASFIFPWNREARLPLLRELGFVVYRGNHGGRIAYPSRKEELWNVPQTYYLNEQSIDKINVILKLLDLTIAYGGVFHVWNHPWNMHINGDVEKFMGNVLIPLFDHAKKRKEEGSLWVCTMRELANYSEARRNFRVEAFTKERNEVRLTVSCSVNDPRFDFPPIVTLKIPLPPRTDALKVFVDEEEVRQAGSWRTTGEWGVRHLLLTLSFKSPSRRVRILTRQD